MGKHDPYADFRKLNKDEQREHILEVCSMCIDGAQRSLARKIEIYFDVTPEEQSKRRHVIYQTL